MKLSNAPSGIFETIVTRLARDDYERDGETPVKLCRKRLVAC